MMERAHFHQRWLLQPLHDLKDELRAVVPGVFSTSEDVLTIQRVQIDHVETAFVVKIRGALRDFSQQSGFRVGHEQSEALLEVVHFRSARMGCDLGSAGSTFAIGEPVRWRFRNAGVRD